MTPRDVLLLQNLSQHFLTIRLLSHVSTESGTIFKQNSFLYRRLNQLEEHDFIKRDRFLLTGEHYFYLSKKGATFLNLDLLPRLTKSIAHSLHEHEYEVSRFWLKFLADSHKLQIQPIQFCRDGTFVYESYLNKLIPDGVAVIKLRGKAHVFCLELDQGTQTSGLRSHSFSIIEKKFMNYERFFRVWRDHPQIQDLPYKLGTARVMFVSRSEQRKQNLLEIACRMGLSDKFLFTTQSHYLDETDPYKAKGWAYKKVNVLNGDLFSRPSRAPPSSLL